MYAEWMQCIYWNLTSANLENIADIQHEVTDPGKEINTTGALMSFYFQICAIFTTSPYLHT